MVNRLRVRIPAVSTLIAFESAGRLGNFSRAAEELQTSQSAISRHIAKLEEHLSTRVFDRSRTGVCLTEAGNNLYDAVASGLRLIDSAITETGDAPDEQHVAVACSHDAWQLVLMPRLDAIQEALDGNSVPRVLLYPHDPGGLPLDPDTDVLFTWHTRQIDPESMAVKESVRPVCSSEYAKANAEILDGPVGGWGGLTLLDFPAPDRRWASWDDWFETGERPDPLPRILELENYSDVLCAATAGKGVALGWRYCVERYIDAGALVPLGDGFVEFDNYYFGLLTEKGRRKPAARDFLAFMARSVQN